MPRSNFQVHQLVHGYRQGHELLSGSIALPRADSELVTRISDLSGPSSSELTNFSYLTGYPLPTSPYYALARTWPDIQASRSGCVLTHTLLVPIDQWRTLSAPQLLDDLFQYPRDLTQFKVPVVLEGAPEPALTSTDSGFSAEFTWKFFSQGIRPLVWIEESEEEPLAWSILSGLWPSLRGQFSFCTLALQPRTLEERPFDLQFAPGWVYTRFHRLAREQVIGVSSRKRPMLGSELEPWCQHWHNVIFGGSNVRLALGDLAPLFLTLGPDPISIRRLFLLEELLKRVGISPTAAIGALDVAESLAPEPEHSVDLKVLLAQRALQAIRKELPQPDAFDSLRLIGDRFAKLSFAEVIPAISDNLTEAVAQSTQSNPSLGLVLVERWLLQETSSRIGESFTKGLFLGLNRTMHVNPQKLEGLRDYPHLAPAILEGSPSVAPVYLDVTIDGHLSWERSSQDLIGWIGKLQSADTRRTVRRALLPTALEREMTSLLPDLLNDLVESDVKGVLALTFPETALDLSVSIRRKWDSERREQHTQRPSRVLDLLEDKVSRRFPAAVRSWLSSSQQWSWGLARMAAATFDANELGFRQMIDESGWQSYRKAEMLAAFLERLPDQWLPPWVSDVAAESISFWDQLMVEGPLTTSKINEQVSRLIRSVQYAPALIMCSIWIEGLEESDFRSAHGQLVDLAMRTASCLAVTAKLKIEVLDKWNDRFPSWYETVSNRDLEAIISQWRFSPDCSAAAAWHWLSHAPSQIYTRESFVLGQLVDILILNTSGNWADEATEDWLKILKRSKVTGRGRLRLCMQALRYCFANPQFPLGSVVSEVFSDVYAAVTGSSFPEALNFFSFLDWDKGKQLRQELIDSFLRSKWSPGELALAPHDDELLRKIIRRLLRNDQGYRYMQKMIEDLGRTQTVLHKKTKAQLSQLSKHPDYQEDWD